MHQIHSRLDPAHRKTYAAFGADEGMNSLLSVTSAVLEQEPASRMMVFYGNRDASQVPQLEELQALKDRYLQRLSLHFFFSDEPQEVQVFNGRLDSEKVRALAGSLFVPAAVDDFFLCGPEDLNQAVAGALRSLGVDAGRVHGERSVAQAKQAIEQVQEAPAPAAQTNSSEVTVLIDGRRRSFTMARDGGTVLDAAEQAGLDLPFSCRAGVCSTCRTKVTKGAVEMAQNYALEPWEVEQGYVLACQSHPTTPELELDYDDK